MLFAGIDIIVYAFYGIFKINTCIMKSLEAKSVSLSDLLVEECNRTLSKKSAAKKKKKEEWVSK